MNRSGGEINFTKLIILLRWPVIIVVGICILVVELFEHPDSLVRWDNVFTTEVVLLESLLLAIGMVSGWLVKVIGEKTSKVNILQAKSELSHQLTIAQDWDEMTGLLAEYPGKILPLRTSTLLLYSKQKKKFDVIASWSSDSNESGKFSPIPLSNHCYYCVFDHPFMLRPMESSCSVEEIDLNFENLYCYPLSYGETTRAMLQLSVEPGTKPTSGQDEMLNNLGPIMAIAMRAAQENRSREQLAAENATQVVRQAITRDMHDMLAQNMAYLQLKLDDLSKLEHLPNQDDLQRDLLKLRDVAGESNELIRNTLTGLHPSNRIRLAEILTENAKIFAERTNLEVIISQEGQSRSLDPMLVHHLNQLFRESLNNIHKHADAKLVETHLLWDQDQLTLTVKDDGCGFDEQAALTKEHFGLGLMRERVEEIHGEIWIDSSPGCGSIITISVPVPQDNGNPDAAG